MGSVCFNQPQRFSVLYSLVVVVVLVLTVFLTDYAQASSSSSHHHSKLKAEPHRRRHHHNSHHHQSSATSGGVEQQGGGSNAARARASLVTPLELGSCQGVAEMFAQKVGTLDPIPKYPIKGGNLTVCMATQHHHHRSSCCTDSMEDSFVRSSEDFVRKQMKNSNSKLKFRIQHSLRVYADHLETSMENSKNQTSHQLTNLLKIPKEAHGKALDNLFNKLREFVKSMRHHNLQDMIHEFFSNLFPAVYEHSVSSTPSSSSSHPTTSFHQCLKSAHEDIKPFGDIPRDLAKRMKFAFQRAKAVVDTLNIMLDAIHVAESVSIDRNCKKALAKLEYCSMCSTYNRVKPCRGFCLNVMRGCLPNIADLSPAWDSLVVSFENLNLGLLRKNNVQEVLGYFGGNVTNAVLHALDDGPRIHQQVVEKCRDSMQDHHLHSAGLPKRFTSAKGLAPTPSHHIVGGGGATSGSLRKDILQLIGALEASKGFLSLLADGLCRESEIFDQDMRGDTCWNGTSIGRYTRDVPVATLINQAQYNMEVKVNLYPKHKLLEVKDTLNFQRRNLSNLFNEELMIGDQSLGGGSGRGELAEIIGDDEDYASMMYSGSGSGDDEEDDGIDGGTGGDPQNRLTPTRNPTQNGGDSEQGGGGGGEIPGRDNNGVNSISNNGPIDKEGSYEISNNDKNNNANNNNKNNNNMNDNNNDGGAEGSGVTPRISWVSLFFMVFVSRVFLRCLSSPQIIPSRVS